MRAGPRACAQSHGACVQGHEHARRATEHACRATEHACRATSMRAEPRACAQSHGACVQGHEHACRATSTRAEPRSMRAEPRSMRAEPRSMRAERRASVQSDVHPCRATYMLAEGSCHLFQAARRATGWRAAPPVRPTWLNFNCLSAKQRYDQAFCLDLQQEPVGVCPNNSLFR